MVKEKTLENLFHDTLKDIYYAERHILKALPKMVKGAQDERLKKAFEKHKTQTETHIERLKSVFAEIEKKPTAKKCDAIEGILKEGEGVLEEYKGMPALDAGLIAAAQAVEHYEMTRYGTLRRWAKTLGLKEAEKLLAKTLEEESKTDTDLTELADAYANAEGLDVPA